MRGQKAGEAQAKAMGDYVLQDRMNDGRPVYRLMDNSFGSRYLFYSKQYKSWSIGREIGGDQVRVGRGGAAARTEQTLCCTI